MSPEDCSTLLRAFAGPEADELAILCRPQEPAQDALEQSAAAYRALARALADRRASFRDLTAETLFLRDIRRDLPRVLAAREQVLAELGQAACAPAPAFIQQPPVDGDGVLALAASAVVPRARDTWSVRDVHLAPACGCAGCARSGARLVRLGDQVSLHTANVYGAGDGVFAQASDMFRAAERLLRECDMGVGDVVRTWIHLRDIDRDYDALNAVRRAFFERSGIALRPASTGVQGIPLPDAHDCALSFTALASRRRDIAGMSTPLLNEAWSYGADFSRGLKVVGANATTLHVSGTASIDQAGRSVHAGDFAAQAERMLDNVESLLARQGASFASVVSAVTYLRRPGDAPLLRSLYRRRGFTGFPCALVEAALCRPELLCETEAVALLPPDAAGA